jgi:hypothetical protein
MLKKAKFLILAGLLALPSFSFSQLTTYSPYSRFGLGDLVLQGSARNFAMGGIGLGLRDGNYINYINPASYSEQDTLTFLFDAGLTGNYKVMQTNSQSLSLNNAGLNHFLLGFPITKWFKSSLGLVPYSRVGYKLVDYELIPNIGIVDYSYEGSGGLNKAFLGNSIRINKNISFGINASYLFGSLTRSRGVSFPSDQDIFATQSRGRVIINDFYFTYGLQFTMPVMKDYTLTAGMIYEPQSKVKAYNDMFVENILVTSSSVTRDTIINITGDKDHVNLPSNLGVGITLRNGNKLIVGADFYTQDWSNTQILGEPDSLTKSNSIKFGIQYQPDQTDFRNYFKRIQYRAGFHHSQTYLKIRGQQLTDYGITLGFGLPFKNTRTTFNFAVDYGQRGTLSQNLIKENYFNFNFSLSLYDFWFFKRRID